MQYRQLSRASVLATSLSLLIATKYFLIVKSKRLQTPLSTSAHTNCDGISRRDSRSFLSDSGGNDTAVFPLDTFSCVRIFAV